MGKPFEKKVQYHCPLCDFRSIGNSAFLRHMHDWHMQGECRCGTYCNNFDAFLHHIDHEGGFTAHFLACQLGEIADGG